MFVCQAEDGIRDLVRSRGLGDVYKRQVEDARQPRPGGGHEDGAHVGRVGPALLDELGVP